MKKDIAELQSFEKETARQRVKDILSIEIRKLTSELLKLEEQLRQVDTTTSSNSSSNIPKSRYEVNLTNYGR